MITSAKDVVRGNLLTIHQANDDVPVATKLGNVSEEHDVRFVSNTSQSTNVDSNDYSIGLDSTLDIDTNLANPPEGVFERLIGDQAHFYSKESLANLGLAFGVGALAANSDFDAQVQRHFQSSIRNATSDDWFEFLRANKELGNGAIVLPVFGSLWLADEFIDGPPQFETAGKWGQRSMRAFIVGAPPLILTQNLTGGSRPYETPENSHWRPFHDDNGVSGHAFVSAIPFITAAKMTDNPWEKTFWYAGSTLGGLSRINDNAHYTSQVGLGWTLAFVAASAVDQTDTGKKGWSVISKSTGPDSGVAIQYRW